MSNNKKPRTAEICEQLALPILEELGLNLWDLRFEEEGGTWYLRYFIDKEGGVDINDCENFSRAVDKKLDEVDPISHGYCLEVSSPGIERELTREHHFAQYMGEQVHLRRIRPLEGERDFVGKLQSADRNGVTLVLEDGRVLEFLKKETAYIRLCDTFELDGGEE